MTIFEIPEPWNSAMRKVGAFSPLDGEVSMNALSRRAGVHTSTIARTIRGDAGAAGVSANTIKKLAAALELPEATIAEWTKTAWSESKEYVAPIEAGRLTARQRKLVDDLIRTLAEANDMAMGGRAAPVK